MEESLPTDISTAPVEETTAVETQIQPTKSVGTFWERLDEVFKMNLQAQQMREEVEQLLEDMPGSESTVRKGKSYLFQPERITLSSNDDVIPPNNLAAYSTSDPEYIANVGTSEYFSSFRIRLKRALVGVKSIQLLSAVIPNAIQNIPDNSTYFFYYKIRDLSNSQLGAYDLGEQYNQGDIVTAGGNTYVCRVPNNNVNPLLTYWTPVVTFNPNIFVGPWSPTQPYVVVGALVSYQGTYWQVTNTSTGIIPGEIYWKQVTLPANLTLPNYWDFSPNSLQHVRLLPSSFLPEGLPIVVGGNAFNLVNRTYQNYNDLATALQLCAGPPITASIFGNDVNFTYDPVLNKFTFAPNVAGNPNSYYIPAGYEDPNVTNFLKVLAPGFSPFVSWTPGYTLNLRLGFTWNGLTIDPFEVNPYSDLTVANVYFAFMRPIDPRYLAPPYNKLPWTENVVTANNYCDLVNTSCVRIYTDVTLGSTQDSNNKDFTDAEGLLSIVPVNASNLGVGFYQNNFNNELTKIPDIIPEIGIRLVNDQGLPFNLPNSATVILELAITYN